MTSSVKNNPTLITAIVWIPIRLLWSKQDHPRIDERIDIALALKLGFLGIDAARDIDSEDEFEALIGQ